MDRILQTTRTSLPGRPDHETSTGNARWRWWTATIWRTATVNVTPEISDKNGGKYTGSNQVSFVGKIVSSTTTTMDLRERTLYHVTIYTPHSFCSHLKESRYGRPE